MKKVFNLLVVDESGSMNVIRRQALHGINETLRSIRQLQHSHGDVEQRVTLITFDSYAIKTRYDNLSARKVKTLGWHDYRPDGCTPLYDAIGKGISMLNAYTTSEDNVLVTIITDGEENCSHEYNLQMVKNLIGKLKKQNWTFTFIGTEGLDVEGMADSMGIDNHLEFRQDDRGTNEMFERELQCRERYNRELREEGPRRSRRYFREED